MYLSVGGDLEKQNTEEGNTIEQACTCWPRMMRCAVIEVTCLCSFVQERKIRTCWTTMVQFDRVVEMTMESWEW